MSRKRPADRGAGVFCEKMEAKIYFYGLWEAVFIMDLKFSSGDFLIWSMFVLGGICLLFCAKQGLWTGWREPLWKQVLWCTIFVTAAEFITGMIVNQWLGWNVWDYTGRKWQLFGQICLPFTIIFSALCVIGILLSGYLLYWLYGEEKPHFHVL